MLSGRAASTSPANGGNSLPYGNVELYLMGLIPASQLEKVVVAKNPKPTAIDGQFTADGFDTYTPADLIARSGARFPPVEFSPKRFDVLFVLVSNTQPTDAEIAEFDNQIEVLTRQGSSGTSAECASTHNFWSATGGRAMIVPFDIGNVPADGSAISEPVLDWAEHIFPSLFPSLGKTTGQTLIYKYSCYSTKTCLGLDEQRNVFFFDGKTITPVGNASDYAAYMRAAGF